MLIKMLDKIRASVILSLKNMELFYRTRKIEKLCTNSKVMQKELGAECANILKRRIAQLGAAPNLDELQPLARCHPLKGKRKAQYAVDLKHPFRLVFEPHWDALQMKKGDPIEIKSITIILIIEIVDYH